MKFFNALFILRVTASVMTMPIEVTNGDLVATPCDWNDICFIICSDESEPAAELTDGTGPGICGVDWTSGLVWAEDIDVDEYGVGSTLALDTSAESFFKRELDVAAHADWKDTLDVGGHVDWNNKADTTAKV